MRTYSHADSLISVKYILISLEPTFALSIRVHSRNGNEKRRLNNAEI